MPSKRLLSSVALLAWALGCNPDREPSGPDLSQLSPRFDAAVESSTPLVEHIIAPQATDPTIDRFLDNHYAWLDTTARTNHKLFVFMPGAGQAPAMFQQVQQEAARLGYHVIGLSYVTRLGGVPAGWPGGPQPAAGSQNEPLENPDWHRPSPLVTLTAGDSLDHRRN